MKCVPHPGKILNYKFMAPRGLNSKDLAKVLQMPPSRIMAIVSSSYPMPINHSTATKLARFFGNQRSYWLHLQNDYDDAQTRMDRSNDKQRHAPDCVILELEVLSMKLKQHLRPRT